METIKIGKWKSRPNAGFVRRLVLVPARDIEELPDPALLFSHTDPQTLPISDVAFKLDTQLFTFDFEYQSCQYSLTQGRSADGPLYLINIQGTIPRLLPAITAELERNRTLRWVAFFQDHNHNFYIAGTPDYPLNLDYSQSLTDSNANRVFISGRTPQAPYNTNALPSLTRHFSSSFGRVFD